MISSLSGPSRRLAVRGLAVSGVQMSAPAIATTAGASCLFSTAPSRKNVVIVDGVRLPFAMSSTIYSDELAVDLQRLAFQGLMTKTALDKSLVDYVIAGNVIQEVRTSNIAREASLNAGLPISIGSHTVAMVRTFSPIHYIPALQTEIHCFVCACEWYIIVDLILFILQWKRIVIVNMTILYRRVFRPMRRFVRRQKRS
jgi:hypothetical protein